MRKWWFAVGVAGLVGCTGGKGGGGTPAPPATPTLKIRYTDPVSTGWRIGILAPASNVQRVVLSLYGPAGQQLRGSALTIQFDPALKVETLETYVGRPTLIIRKGKQEFMGATDGGTYAASQPMQSWAVELAAPKVPGDLSLAVTKMKFVGPDGKEVEQTVALGKLEAIP